MCHEDWMRETFRMNKRLSSIDVECEPAVTKYLSETDESPISAEPLLSDRHGVEEQAGASDVVLSTV